MNRMQLANKAKEEFIKRTKAKQQLTAGEKEVLESFEQIKPDKDGFVTLYEGKMKNTYSLSMDF